MTTTTDPFANVRYPAGAVFVDEWSDLNTDTPFRYFEGLRRVVDRPHHDIEVHISGAQHHDGSVTRDIVVHELHHDEPITVEQARLLAAARTEAADKAERMADCDRITVS